MRTLLRSLLAILIIAIVVGLVFVIAEQPGRVAIIGPGWRMDPPLGLLIGAGLIAALLAALVLGLLWRLLLAPASLLRFRRERRRLAGYRALTHGMVAVAAGDAEEAQRQARKANGLLSEPPLTLLLAAQAAQLRGDEAAAERYFTTMLNRAETEFLGLRGLITRALRRGDEATALRLAGRAQALRPKTPWVLNSLFELHTRRRDWRAAEEILAALMKERLLPPAEGRHREAALLAAASREEEAAGRAGAALALAAKAQNLAPGFAPAAARHAELLHAGGQTRKAARALEALWRHAPHPHIAALYGRLFADEAPLARLKRIEALAANNEGHAESRLALAAAALEAGLWGEARRHLAALPPAHPGSRAAQLAAAIEAGEQGGAVPGALVPAGAAADDPRWTCAACGAETAEWSPLCPRCRGFDTLAWTSPAPQAAASAAASTAAAAAPTG